MIIPLTSLPQQGITDDGITVRLCPINKTKGKPIYCSCNGEFFSYRLIRDRHTGLARYRFCRLRPQWYRGFKRTNNVHSAYPYIGSSRGTTCHMLMALTWLGVRPAGCECDHINGNIYDWRACNLEWVTPAENRKRAVILRARRMIAKQDGRPELLPENMKAEELLALFNAYNVAGDVNEGE